MTPADHANTVREALAWDFHAAEHDYHGNRLIPAEKMDEFGTLCANARVALDALVAQAEAAEADRDSARSANGELAAERDAALDREAGTADALDSMRAERDRLAEALRLADNWLELLVEFADAVRAALAQTKNVP